MTAVTLDDARRVAPPTLPALLTASWLAVRRGRALVPVGAALLLVGATVAWQDGGQAVPVLHGVAVLVACAVAAASDDPAAEVVAAAPFPRRTRTLGRLLAALAVGLPVFVVAAAVAEARFEPTRLDVHVIEVVVLVLAAAAVGATVRAAGVHTAGYPAVLGVVVLVFAMYLLPRSHLMVDPQTWGPPWQAALLRWTAVGVLATGVLTLALRDPARSRPRPRP